MQGVQGCGVSTPSAAEVAAATCGLAMLMHMPKDRMFVIGTWSRIVDAGVVFQDTFFGSTPMTDGVVPKLHFRMAPSTT